MSSPPFVALGALAAVIAVGVVGFDSFTVVEPSTVGVKSTLGHLDNDVLTEGPHMVLPWSSVYRISVSQGYFHVNLNDVQSQDRLRMQTAVTFQYRRNPAAQVMMYQSFKGDDVESILRPAAMSSLREAMSRFTADEATGDKRETLIQTIRDDFERAIIANLVSNGLTEAQAKAAYIIPAVQLQSVTPPERIMSANAEKQASSIDLQRQAILTQIAQQEANRQKMQGEGVSKMFGELPKGYTAQDVYYIMSAITMKENADSFYRAVESGKVSVFPVPQQSSLSLPTMGK